MRTWSKAHKFKARSGMDGWVVPCGRGTLKVVIRSSEWDWKVRSGGLFWIETIQYSVSGVEPLTISGRKMA